MHYVLGAVPPLVDFGYDRWIPCRTAQILTVTVVVLGQTLVTAVLAASCAAATGARMVGGHREHLRPTPQMAVPHVDFDEIRPSEGGAGATSPPAV